MGVVSRARQPIGVILMMALLVSIGAQCVLGNEMTATQMACCVGTDHDCGTATAAAECCQSETAAAEQLVAKLQQVVFPLAPITGVPAMLLAPPDAHAVRGFDVDRIGTTAESPPTYVLLATFLI
jgi:hypothetical protein